MDQAGGNEFPKKIVVIGGSGLIGSYIVQKCIQNGHTVVATHHKPLANDKKQDIAPNIPWTQVDILNLFELEDCFEGQDVVINTAAMVTFNPKSKKDAFRLAREGTANIVEVAVSKGIQKLVHVSSIAALGRKKMINHIDESSIFSHSEYDTVYGLSKFLAEQEVWRGHYEGLPATILNPSMVIGAGHWGQSSTKIITSIAQGLSRYPIGSNGFVDVRDVAEAAVRAIHPRFSGERFIVNSENLTFEQVFKNVSLGLGLQTDWKPLTPFLSSLAWRFEKLKSGFTGKEPSLSRDQAKSMQTESYYDNKKSTETMGLTYRNMEISIGQTTQQYLLDQNRKRAFSMLPQ